MADESSKELVNRAERASREVAGFQELGARSQEPGASSQVCSGRPFHADSPPVCSSVSTRYTVSVGVRTHTC